MVLPKNLKQQCVAVFYDHAKKVLRSSKDGKAEQSVQFALQRLITVYGIPSVLFGDIKMLVARGQFAYKM